MKKTPASTKNFRVQWKHNLHTLKDYTDFILLNFSRKTKVLTANAALYKNAGTTTASIYYCELSILAYDKFNYWSAKLSLRLHCITLNVKCLHTSVIERQKNKKRNIVFPVHMNTSDLHYSIQL